MLQDSVPVFPTDIARQVVEEELGKTIEEVFSEFSTEPIAAASLAQVSPALQSCLCGKKSRFACSL